MSELSNPHDRFFKDLFTQPDVAANFLFQTRTAWIILRPVLERAHANG
jgi:hypothetical protein